MALTATDYAVKEVTSPGTGAATPSSYTVPANSFVVVQLYGIASVNIDGNVGAAFTLSDNNELTWMKQFTHNSADTWYGGAVFTAQFTAGGTLTLSADNGLNNLDFVLFGVRSYTGHDVASPIGATAAVDVTTTDGAKTLTLSGAPATTSDVLGFDWITGGGGTAGATEGSGFAEVYQQAASGGAAYAGIQAINRTGSTSTSVLWADVQTGTAYGAAQAAMEIKAAAVNASQIMLMGVG